mgnify:CR=1 FL=1
MNFFLLFSAPRGFPRAPRVFPFTFTLSTKDLKSEPGSSIAILARVRLPLFRQFVSICMMLILESNVVELQVETNFGVSDPRSF